MKKILLAALKHETNTFLNYKTKSEDFTVLRGNDVITTNCFPGTSGALSVLSNNPSVEIKPVLFARAIPGGVVDKYFYLYIKEEILESVSAVNPDGILLDLHGSMYVDEIGDAEGDLLSSIRTKVGKEVPIVCVLDMHATMTEKMLENADAFSGYRTAPHVDIFETGVRAAKILEKMLGGKHLYMFAKRIPVLLSGERSDTRVEPMKSLITLLKKQDQNPSILDSSYLLGYPWADVPSNGAYAVVISDDKAIGKRISDELAEEFWNKREKFGFSAETADASEAILRAAKSDATVKPVILSDACDNPTAGSAGDNTNILKEIFEAKKKGLLSPNDKIALLSIPDIESLEKIIQSESDEIEIFLGGKIDCKYSSPLKIKGLRKKVLMKYNNETDVVLFSSNNVDIVITSKRFGIAEDTAILNKLRMNPEDYKIIVLKSGYLSDEYAKIAKKSLFALTEGYCNQDITKMPFKKISRPIFPLDRI